MYAMLRDCNYPGTPACGDKAVCVACNEGRDTDCPEFERGDWLALEDQAMTTKADADDLLDVITKTVELIAGRPTEPPASSSPGRRGISGRSTATSSARRAKGSRR
jgi:hypothetical protein